MPGAEITPAGPSIDGLSGRGNRRALSSLMLASFGIGTGEFVIVGLVPNVASDLHVPVPTAGLTAGGLIGGRIADRHALPAVRVLLAVDALALIGVGLVLQSAPLAFASIFIWGIAAFALVPPLQQRVATGARGRFSTGINAEPVRLQPG